MNDVSLEIIQSMISNHIDLQEEQYDETIDTLCSINRRIDKIVDEDWVEDVDDKIMKIDSKIEMLSDKLADLEDNLKKFNMLVNEFRGLATMYRGDLLKNTVD
jgi:hypothetical protein